MGICRSNERGASTVEFALIAPLFFFFIFTVIESSSFLYARNTVGMANTDVARDASIAASKGTTDNEIVNKLVQYNNRTFGVELKRIVIYKASDLSSEPDDSCKQGTSGPTCAVYDAEDFVSPVCKGWCGKDRRPDDYLGIWTLTNYSSIARIGIFDMDWTDHSVVLLEPEVL